MIFFVKNTLILSFLLFFTGCEILGMSKVLKIEDDAVVKDLSVEIKELETTMSSLSEENVKLAKHLDNPELDTELKMAIKRELFEAKQWNEKIFEHVAYRKISLKQRKALLKSRQSMKKDTAELRNKEKQEYFQNKRLKPLKKGWEERFKAALDI